MAFRSWFPRSIQEQAAFYRNFTRVFAEIAPHFGFTTEDIAELEADNDVMQYLAQIDFAFKVFKRAFATSKNSLTCGERSEKANYVSFTPPPAPPIVPCGMFERLFRLADCLKTADNYSSQTGARLGIQPKTREKLRLEDRKLELTAETFENAQIKARFKRMESSGVNLYFHREGSEQVHDLGRFIKSPAIVKIPLVDGKPERIYVFGRYLDGNDAVGDYSPRVELLVAP